MDIASKAKGLLSEIEKQIGETEKNLNQLRAQRKEIAKLVGRMAGTSRRGSRASAAGNRRGPGKRTDWNRVLENFKGPFTLDDLSNASGKRKPTVNQAVQKLKRAGKIKSTGKRGEYERAAAKNAPPQPKPKKKAVKAKKKTTKKSATKKVAAQTSAAEPKQGESS